MSILDIHPAAKAWDKANEKHAGPLHTPQGRPCDRCGLPVPRGFVHRECLEVENIRLHNIARVRILANPPPDPVEDRLTPAQLYRRNRRSREKRRAGSPQT